MNVLSKIHRRIHYVLYEECDDARYKNSKNRRMLHNAHLIQLSATMAGLGAWLSIPVAMWLISIPYFVIGYTVFFSVAGTFLTVGKYLEKRVSDKELKQSSGTGTDSYYEALS